MGLQPPCACARGRETLAWTMARLHRHHPVIPDRLQNLLLLAPEEPVQLVVDPADWVVDVRVRRRLKPRQCRLDCPFGQLELWLDLEAQAVSSRAGDCGPVPASIASSRLRTKLGALERPS